MERVRARVWAIQAVTYREDDKVAKRVGGLNTGGELLVTDNGGEVEVVIDGIRHTGESRESVVRFTLTRDAANLLVREIKKRYGAATGE